MAIPMQHMVVPPPMQFPSQQPLHPSVDLLAAMDGWDPMRMYNLAHLGASLGPEMGMGPLEGAGRMGQAGGVMSRSLPARPTQAGEVSELHAFTERLRGQSDALYVYVNQRWRLFRTRRRSSMMMLRKHHWSCWATWRVVMETCLSWMTLVRL